VTESDLVDAVRSVLRGVGKETVTNR
jgi:hypothetical protein